MNSVGPYVSHEPRRLLSRRAVLGAGAGGIVVAGAGTATWGLARGPTQGLVGPDSAVVAAVEARRTTTGATVGRNLRPASTEIDLGGRVVRTWALDGQVPGSEIRANVGDRLRVDLDNDLTDPTTVHWHGLALRNDMDGVPGMTQRAVAPGQHYRYEYVLPHSGTYWYHPHVGVQLDTGLYGPLIIDDPAEPGSYDHEAVLALDDWTDGWGPSPASILTDFAEQGMSSMSGMSGSGQMDPTGGVSPTAPLGTDTGDVVYRANLINGRLPAAPRAIRAKPGQRVRLRIINAGGDTAYRFAVGGHRLLVTHADGFPVTPVEVDALILGMGERYDAVVTMGDGTFPIVAQPEGKPETPARAVLTTTSGAVADLGAALPDELSGRLLDYADLSADSTVRLASRRPDRSLTMSLAMVDGGRRWFINGRPYGDREPLTIRQGERVRVTMRNSSSMFHPMHLHGHTFALARSDGAGPRKDTVNVLPGSTLSVDFDADNPGQWLTHCHNVYHGELGMMTQVSYVA